MRAAPWIVCLAVGCSDVLGLTPVVLHDATMTDSPDALMLRPFAVPRAITELDTASNDEDPTLPADRLEILFSSSRPGTAGFDDLWVATRPDFSTPWGTPQPIVEINSASFDAHPSVSADGLTLYFASDRVGGPGGFDLYRTQRASRTGLWAPPVVVTELSSPAQDYSAAVDSTGLTVVISSTRTSGADFDLMIATRATVGASWSAPVLITSLRSDLDDTDGMFADAGRVLYFTRGANGARDLWTATRPSTVSEDWTAAPIDELNTGSSELDPWVSEDQQVMIFNTDRAGTEDLWETYRHRPQGVCRA